MIFRPPENHFLTITYDSSLMHDGIGAQLSRIIDIFHISRIWNVAFMNSPIEDIVRTPTDSWQTESEKKQFLTEVNTAFQYPSNCPDSVQKIRNCTRLTKFILLKSFMLSYCLRKNTLLKVLAVHSAPGRGFRAKPDILSLPPKYRKNLKANNNGYLIVAHIRKVHTSNGKAQSRGLDISYYVELINRVIGDLGDKPNYSVSILTDYPQFDLSHSIATESEEGKRYWQLSSKEILEENVEIEGLDIKEMFFASNPHVRVTHGGNALDSLETMARSDILIVSRSALSAVGSYLNYNGMVIIPPDSWVRRDDCIAARKFIKIHKKWRESSYPFLAMLLPRPIVNFIRRFLNFFGNKIQIKFS